MRKPLRPPHPIPPFVAPRYGDTPEEDRAFRREQVLAALEDGLYRLWLREHGIGLPSDPPADRVGRQKRRMNLRVDAGSTDPRSRTLGDE